MTKAEGRAWKRRWKLVEAAQLEELRATPIDVKFQRLATLMHTARVLGWHTSTKADIKSLRDRWLRLKRAHRDAR